MQGKRKRRTKHGGDSRRFWHFKKWEEERYKSERESCWILRMTCSMLYHYFLSLLCFLLMPHTSHIWWPLCLPPFLVPHMSQQTYPGSPWSPQSWHSPCFVPRALCRGYSWWLWLRNAEHKGRILRSAVRSNHGKVSLLPWIQQDRNLEVLWTGWCELNELEFSHWITLLTNGRSPQFTSPVTQVPCYS